MDDARPDFIVVGGGPVGLLCALALRRVGRSVTLLERCPTPRSETRSIGVHAASLIGLEQLGLLEQFLAAGVRIDRGVALGSRGRLGAVEFGRACPRLGFALSVPQARTEALLERAARAAGVDVVRGAHVITLAQQPDHVAVDYLHERSRRRLRGRYLLGCDGTHGSVRALLGIGEDRRPLPGSFAMAELPATAELGDDAWIFLADAGLVESFPLPDARRRWVVELPTRRERVELVELCALIRERTGHALDPDRGEQPGVFGLTQALARRFHRGRALLLGDAAHTLSPFGGQGMNLGWLDALALAELADRRWTAAGLAEPALAEWARARRRAARSALRQAAWNTQIGRRCPLPRVRNAIVRMALARPLAGLVTRRFAMLELT